MAPARLRYRVARAIDPAFLADYERSMLATCGADPFPNPHRARHGVLHDSCYRVYTRRTLERLVDESGLTVHGRALVEQRNWLVARKHVNVFLALTK